MRLVGNKTVAVVNRLSKEDRRAHKRQLFRIKRTNEEFKDKENKAKKGKKVIKD